MDGDTKRIRTVLKHLEDQTDELRVKTTVLTDISEGFHRMSKRPMRANAPALLRFRS